MGLEQQRPFGKALRQIRVIEGYSQKQLAAMTGCTQAYISKCELGAPVSFYKFEEILKAMGYEWDIVVKKIVDA
jgi:transcriptional regulator with XRE-family HTH domain